MVIPVTSLLMKPNTGIIVLSFLILVSWQSGLLQLFAKEPVGESLPVSSTLTLTSKFACGALTFISYTEEKRRSIIRDMYKRQLNSTQVKYYDNCKILL